MPSIDVARVERLARDLIAQYGLVVESVIVRHEGAQWRVAIRDAGQQTFDITLADTHTVAQLRDVMTRQLLERI